MLSFFKMYAIWFAILFSTAMRLRYFFNNIMHLMLNTFKAIPVYFLLELFFPELILCENLFGMTFIHL